MGYGWTKTDENYSEARLPLGVHDTQITKVKRSGQNGEFTSKNGDPQLMVIFEDASSMSASDMYTLSDKAAWRLRMLVQRCRPPLDVAAMEAQGIEPSAFADQNFAEANLVGRKVRISIEADKDPMYPKVVPVRVEGDVQPATPAVTPPPAPAAPPPPPKVPPAPSAPPPKATGSMTKGEAWAAFYDSYVGTNGNSNGCTEAWYAAIEAYQKQISRDEKDFSAGDWFDLIHGVPF